MNYDRFLTRVFDKKEGKMIYPGDHFSTVKGENLDHEFIGIIDEGLIVETHYFNPDVCDEPSCHTNIIPFGDRYIPMQSMGRKDKNDKLFYQHDIIKTHDNCLCTVEINENMSSYDFQLIGDENCRFCCTTLAIKRAEILGNKWEHPKLLNLEANK